MEPSLRPPQPEILWGENDTPFAPAFGDPYFSRLDGRLETRHVFLGGNFLPDRWAGLAEFTVAELGFGTGLNFFETLAAWRGAAWRGAAWRGAAWRGAGRLTLPTPRLTYISLERFPLQAEDLVRAISRWPDLMPHLDLLLQQWPPPQGWSDIVLGQKEAIGEVTLRLGIGDANELLPAASFEADAWFLDGFSPAKNPDMWGEALIRAVFSRTVSGGTFATFTAAGWVRRNLQAAGFQVQKMPGYGRKRECLHGYKPAAT